MKKLQCSFCGKSEDQVARLVAGPNALICDQCVKKAVQAMQQRPDEPVTAIDRNADPAK